MPTSSEIKKKLEEVFDERQATVLAEVFVDAYGELVKTSDFDELKGPRQNNLKFYTRGLIL